MGTFEKWGPYPAPPSSAATECFYIVYVLVLCLASLWLTYLSCADRVAEELRQSHLLVVGLTYIVQSLQHNQDSRTTNKRIVSVVVAVFCKRTCALCTASTSLES